MLSKRTQSTIYIYTVSTLGWHDNEYSILEYHTQRL